MNFSQRLGLEPAVKPFQKDSMDDDLRNGLWNAFDRLILGVLPRGGGMIIGDSRDHPHRLVFVPLWEDFFKADVSGLPQYAFRAAGEVHRWFFVDATWHKVYKFVEFIGNLDGHFQRHAAAFRHRCDAVLVREFSGYRFVGKTLAPITAEAEIQAIKQAASVDNTLLRPVSTHIDTALKRLSDREHPDYRNSIKESISAVESLCRVIVGEPATLGQALKRIKDKVALHSALEKGFSALYGWTNDEAGIRHSLMEESDSCDFDDAKYMLVSCSAFVNYLTEKARKNGLLP